MTWEWSHTPEAYENARLNLADLDTATLIIIAAEWRAAKYVDSSREYEFQDKKYNREFRHLTAQSKKFGEQYREILADEIWPKVEEYATCDNGGFNAHVCPFGCGRHTVSFDRYTPDPDSAHWDRFDICLAWYVYACESYQHYEDQCEILARLDRMQFKAGLTDSSSKMRENWRDYENALNILAKLEASKGKDIRRRWNREVSK